MSNTPEEKKEGFAPEAQAEAADTKAAEATDAACDTPDGEKGDKKAKRKRKPRPSRKPKKEETEEERLEREKKEEQKKKNKPKNVKEATKRLSAYLTQYKGLLVLVCILVVISTIMSYISMVGPMYFIINALENLDTVYSGDEAMAIITKWIIIMIIGIVIAAVSNFAFTRIMLRISSRTLANMRRDLFNHLQTLPLEFFDKRKTGEIMSHFTNDINRVSDMVSSNMTNLISAVLKAVMSISLLLILSWRLTLTITVAIVLMFFVVMLITSKCSPLFKKQQKAIAEVNGYTEEYIKGIKVVQLFCQEERTKAQFNILNENYKKTGIKANIIGGFMSPLMSMITRVNFVIVVILGSYFYTGGTMTLATLTTYIRSSSDYVSPIAQLASCYSSLISALAGAERVFEVLDTPSETDEGRVKLTRIIKNALGEDVESDTDEGAPAWKVPTDSGFTLVPLKGNIEVKDITFAYVEGTDVLKNISITAPGGQKVAFVGSTGAGKTTITNLINRFYEVNRGEITYDGIPICDIEKASLRHSMAMVLQDTRLFAGTIADNIRYGKLDATDEEVIAAAKIANAHSFIEKLPDGYETEIKPDAANISTGQAQLINIARAAIAGAPLLILDEATSSVDTRTERLIEVAMDKIMEDRTVFVIAHRLSTVRNSQNIVVLENGEIIEEGDHQSLIDLGGKYYQLYTGAFEMK